MHELSRYQFEPLWAEGEYVLSRSVRDRAIAVCLAYLRRIGIAWSPHPTEDEVQQEYEQVWRRLGSRQIEALVALPPMTDAVCVATMNVLAELLSPALVTEKNLLHLAIARMVTLSLEHGNADASCFGYAYFGAILGPRFGDYPAAFHFGQLAVDLVEQAGLDRFKARVYLAFGTLTIPWTRPLRMARPLFRSAFDTATRVGDLTFAAYGRHHLVSHLLGSGEPLGEVQREAEDGLAFARQAQFGLVVDTMTVQLQFIRALRGLTAHVASFRDTQFDEDLFEHHLVSDAGLAFATCWYWIRKVQACVYAEDYAAALDAATKAQRLLWTSPAPLELADYHFYGALAQAAQYDAVSTDAQPQHLEALIVHSTQLAVWAEHCPENFGNRAALVGAEMARLAGHVLKAERAYEEAIQLARAHGFLQHEGLANERAARFYAARGFETIAHAYLRHARYCYLRWGADGKVRQLDRSHPHLREEAVVPCPTTTIGVPVAHLDVGMVVKASQAMSGEIVLDRLIETLMTIALEHAGAERGMLILLRNNTPWIEAEAQTGPASIAVVLRHAAVTPTALPTSVLHTVLQTRQSVLLDDAQRANPFTEDAYVQQRRPRAVLCLPLVKQAALIGLLYLENTLASGTFTPPRTAALELLASQAAISLENARLYTELLEENRERQKAEEALRASEASLAEGQQISHTGSWRWNMRTGEVRGSAEHSRICGFDPAAGQGPHRRYRERVHPDDRPAFAHLIDSAVRDKRAFQHEYRLLLPDGVVKHVQSVGHPDTDAAGDLEFTGTIMDVTARKRAEEALRNAQSELTRVARLTTMGELTASIAHEVNQPLAAIVTNGDACARLLAGTPPNLEEAREAVAAMIRDGLRASDVIRRVRALVQKTPPPPEWLDINALILDVLALTRIDVQRYGVVLHTHLATDLPTVRGDRIQVQQVLLNLLVNAIDALRGVPEGARTVQISSGTHASQAVRVAVRDTGIGLAAESLTHLFDAFYTTKPEGMGLGLAISRTVIEGHGGQLWASPNAGPGATFQFTLPAGGEQVS